MRRTDGGSELTEDSARGRSACRKSAARECRARVVSEHGSRRARAGKNARETGRGRERDARQHEERSGARGETEIETDRPDATEGGSRPRGQHCVYKPCRPGVTWPCFDRNLARCTRAGGSTLYVDNDCRIAVTDDECFFPSSAEDAIFDGVRRCDGAIAMPVTFRALVARDDERSLRLVSLIEYDPSPANCVAARADVSSCDPAPFSCFRENKSLV